MGHIPEEDTRQRTVRCMNFPEVRRLKCCMSVRSPVPKDHQMLLCRTYASFCWLHKSLDRLLLLGISWMVQPPSQTSNFTQQSWVCEEIQRICFTTTGGRGQHRRRSRYSTQQQLVSLGDECYISRFHLLLLHFMGVFTRLLVKILKEVERVTRE